MKKTLMCDLDGTIVWQTARYVVSTVKKTLYELGPRYDKARKILRDGEILNDFAYEFWYGSERDEIIEKRLGLPYMEFWKIFWKYDTAAERVRHTEIYDDVKAFRNLKEKGVKLGIVTGALEKVASAEIAKIMIETRGWEFDSIVSNNPEKGIKQKPEPDTLLICLKELKVKNSEAVYVGNSPEDADAAINAEVTPVVILREPIKRVNYKRSVKLINSLYELEGLYFSR